MIGGGEKIIYAIYFGSEPSKLPRENCKENRESEQGQSVDHREANPYHDLISDSLRAGGGEAEQEMDEYLRSDP